MAVFLQGHVAYVPQQAWILNLTLRDNILLNKPLDQVSYQEVLSACALTADIDLLPGADFTEIGEKVWSYLLYTDSFVYWDIAFLTNCGCSLIVCMHSVHSIM